MINRLTGKDEKSVKVVIEILEDDYKNLMIYKDNPNGRNWAEQRIIAGTPLPKGYGRLIDADELQRRYCDANCGQRKCVDAMDRCVFIDAVLESHTIIEADTKRSKE